MGLILLLLMLSNGSIWGCTAYPQKIRGDNSLHGEKCVKLAMVPTKCHFLVRKRFYNNCTTPCSL